MIDKSFREKLAEEVSYDTVLFDNPSFDNSIIGITSDGKVIYDFDLMVDELKTDESFDEIEAIEYIEYNTVRSLPYIEEEVRPVIMYKIER